MTKQTQANKTAAAVLDAARDALDAAIADDFDDAAADRDAARDAYRADAAYRAEVVKA